MNRFTNFCYIGKKIDKCIEELGGQRITSLVCIDEVEGLEEDVELWLDQFRK